MLKVYYSYKLQANLNNGVKTNFRQAREVIKEYVFIGVLNNKLSTSVFDEGIIATLHLTLNKP